MRAEQTGKETETSAGRGKRLMARMLCEQETPCASVPAADNESFDAWRSVACSRRITARLMDIAEKILTSGGEAGRVEDTIMRLGKAYGFRRVDAFTITSCIFVTVEDSFGNTFTQSRRIRSISTDMEMVRQCNELSRELCRKPLPEEELQQAIDRLSGTGHYSVALRYGAYVMIAACLSVFFGGDFSDFLAAGLAAPLVFAILRLGERAGILNFMVYFLDAFAVGLLIYLLLHLSIGRHYDKIAMANIMLLIPGSGLTTAVREMISGDIMTGMIGFVSAAIQAAAIALGFVAAYILFQH